MAPEAVENVGRKRIGYDNGRAITLAMPLVVAALSGWALFSLNDFLLATVFALAALLMNKVVNEEPAQAPAPKPQVVTPISI